ncbi:MAG: sensor histidine kinase [Acidobacteriota bacterium]
MKIQNSQISKHLPFLALGILSWLGFSYLYVLFLKMNFARSIHNFPWHSDAPIWTFRECLMGAGMTIFVKWKFDLSTEKSKSLLRDFLILAFLIPINSFLITAFHTLVLGATYSGGERSADYNWVMGTISGLIIQTFVSFTCVGYFYMTLVNKTKEKLIYAQRAKAEMELKTLQKNIEPHFLFNNLNVLSSLIEKNPTAANEFLDKLAQLYRYILHTNNAEIVSIKEELEFAENYLYLIKKRFGAAYNFDWQVPNSEINGQMIVPTALQSLLENVVKHNAGSREKPLQIRVKLDEKSLIVENEIRPKSQTNLPSGTGLQNLRARYELLTENPFESVKSEGVFKVRIPLLEIKK